MLFEGADHRAMKKQIRSCYAHGNQPYLNRSAGTDPQGRADSIRIPAQPSCYENHAMKALLCAVWMLMLSWSLWPGLAAASDEPLLVAVDASYPPYMFGAHPAKGLYPEIIRTAFALSGMTVTVDGYPWKRALLLGRSGQAAVGGIYLNLERQAIFDFSDPFYLETLVVCVRKGQRFPFSGVVDLQGKRVGVNRGWSYGEAFDSARKEGLFQAEEATGNQANVKKLLLGRLDCIIADELSLLRILRRMNWLDAVETLDHPATVNSVYVVIAKQNNQSRILESFNQGLAAMKANGSYQRVVSRYLLAAWPE